jgi:hypothetical protein
MALTLRVGRGYDDFDAQGNGQPTDLRSQLVGYLESYARSTGGVGTSADARAGQAEVFHYIG